MVPGVEVIKTPINDLLILKPKVFQDERGYFTESYNQELFDSYIPSGTRFVQDNQSLSHSGVLRGMHFQNPPYAQAKLVRVIRGAVLDVAVDLRKNSPSYGKHFSVELNETNFLQMFIPEGFAHGFLTLKDHTIFYYKCNNYYKPDAEGLLSWKDPDLNIDWNISNPVVSAKDQKGDAFSSFQSPF